MLRLSDQFQRYHYALAIALTLIVAGASVVAFSILSQTARETDLTVLQSEADQVKGLIESRFQRHETRIRSAAAFVTGADHVPRDRWRAFVEQTGAREDGIFEMFWAERLEASELPDLHYRVAQDGIDRWELQPPGERDIYCPIVYTELYELHADSIGLDICTRPRTNPAAQWARNNIGDVAISDSVNLVGDADNPIRGYVLLAWVEPGPSRPGGWVGATVALDSIFANLAAQYPDIAIQVRDLTAGEAVEAKGLSQPDESAATHIAERQVELGGRKFQMQLQQPTSVGPTATMVLLGGLVIALLLGSLLLSILRTRVRAERLATKATKAYRESESLLESVTSNISEGIYRGVPDKGLIYINQALADLFGFQDTEEMISHSGPILYASPKIREKLFDLLKADGAYRNQEVEFVRPDGSHFFAINSAVATLDEEGNIRHFDGVISDITDRKHAEAEAHRLAHYDALTGLPNRSLLSDRIDQAIAHSSRKQRQVAVMFMDLDRFKAVNDSLGHSIGDQLLIAVSARLRDSLRQYDTISRLGGDEFVIVMPGAGLDAAAHKADAIIKEFRQPFEINGHELVITPSIGVTVYPDDGEHPETLLRNADTAMYHAKERGRATFEFFTRELNQRAYERLSMETHLRSALARGELHLVFQPIIHTGTGKIRGAEALLRWNSPILGRVGPDEFIPVAEQSGLIIDIGQWVVHNALQQLASWKRLGMDDLSISVNVSAVQFWRGNLGQTIRQALAESGLQGEDLEIELTENVIMSDVDTARKVLAEIKPLGVHLAIDDFGTGYSSLSYLKQFRIDRLKIDKSFIQELTVDNDDAAIVSAVLSMAGDLGLEVVAEGVETADQLEFLAQRGCGYVQGYFFSEPLTATNLMRLWARTNRNR